MTKKEIDTLKETIDKAIEDVILKIWNLEDTLDRFKDRMNEARAAINDQQAEDLNALIVAGFIPGAKVKYKDVEYQFIGYTETGRMGFKDDSGNIKYSDISVCKRLLDNFTILKDNEQEGGDK